ncbi:MAG TPA: hypothetical protein VJ598_01445, partial [Albitalea sp.]|nr:hypothetical protein [Albitalea sp.]
WLAANPEAAERVQAYRQQNHAMRALFDPVLDEPVPARLIAATQGATSATVIDLGAERASRQAAPAPVLRARWPQWGALAASLVVGIVIGRSAWLAPGDEIATRSGQLVARGELAHSLSTQLASAQAADAPVQIGLSFVSRDGAYCRSFALRRGGSAGLACRQGDDWQLRVLAQDASPASDGKQLRSAASPAPPAVLRAVDEQIQGSALDAEAERAAMQRGWRTH